MDINRTNEAGPSRQSTSEGDEAASTSSSLPIVAVQQAGAEGVLTTHAPSDQAGVPARESVIVQPARAPEPPIANPNQAPGQNTVAHFRPWMAADPTRRPQVSADVRYHPYASSIFRSDILTGSSRLAYPYFLFIQNTPPQPPPRPAFESGAIAGPSRLNQPHASFEQVRPPQPAPIPAFEQDAVAGPSGRAPFEQVRPPQPAPRPVFEQDAVAGPSRRRPDYAPPESRGRLPDYALEGPSTDPKPYAPPCLMYGRLAGDAYPERMRQEAVEIYKGCNNSREVCKQLKEKYPARSPAARTVAKWMRDYKQSLRERERNDETSDSD